MNLLYRMQKFRSYLIDEEKSGATVEKYMRDIGSFIKYLSGRNMSKQEALGYKSFLCKNYAPSSVNSMLVALNCFFRFMGRTDCCVKLLKIQRQMYVGEDKLLSASDYRRLLKAAEGTKLGLVVRTICETGIRVSELKFITAEAVVNGRAEVECKNKRRVIFIPPQLRKSLLQYIKKSGIKAGTVFISESGSPLNRSSIWRSMKTLSKKTGVSPEKVYPHNLRHLFARVFYSIERDIVKLADVLGHSNINTTRIYTLETGERHIYCLEKMHKRLMT